MDARITTFIEKISPLPGDILEVVISYFQHVRYAKKYYLLKQGQPFKYLWFLEQGAVRFFYTNDEGNRSNVWFSIDEDIVRDVPGFVNRISSRESMQPFDDSQLYAIAHHDLQNLLQKHHSFVLWYFKLVEEYSITQIEDRIADLQFLSAKQPYQKLLANFLTISNRVSAGHIAS